MVWRSTICFLALGFVLTACNPSKDPTTITETRTIPPATGTPAPASAGMPAQPGSPVPPAPTAMGGMPPGMGMQNMGAMGGMPPGPSTNYTWTAPEGWETITATPMRKANFKIDGDTECYLTVLSGQAGGVQMNVERWRGQMGLGDAIMKPEEVAALPKVPMAGKEGVLAEMTGTYVSMKGDSKPNYTMLGAIAEMGGEVVFVKMVGPEATVKANREKFLGFCASLQGTATAAANPMSGSEKMPAECPASNSAPGTIPAECPASNPAPDTTNAPAAK